MKKLIFLFAVLFSISSNAKGKAPFQGKITYDIEIEGENTDFMAAFMFTKYTFYFGQNSIRLHLTGGMSLFMGDFITNNQSEKSYMVDDESQIAYEISDTVEEEDLTARTVVETKEKEQILGYKCLKYEVTTIDVEGKSTLSEYWVTTEIRPQANENVEVASTLFIDGIEGFPLKIVIHLDSTKMIQTATEILNETPDENLFTIPDSYQVKPFSESPLMKMGEEDE